MIQTRVSSLPSSVRHCVGLSKARSKEMTADHLAVNGVHPRALSLVWEEQDGFRDGLGCFYPTVWLVEDVCHVGWYRIVVFYHLLQRKQVKRRVLVESAFCYKWRCQGVFGGEKKCIQAIRASMRLFFSSPLTGPWKNVPRTEYILYWSPGARVGQAWLNVEAMNGSGVLDTFGSGIAIGMCGLAVAEVGGGGRARKSGRMPGIKSVTTFCMNGAFWTSVDM